MHENTIVSTTTICHSPVTGELKGEILLPLALHILSHGLGGLEPATGLGHTVGVDLLGQGDQSGLSSLTDLLKQLGQNQ